jgi:hypothetical protein
LSRPFGDEKKREFANGFSPPLVEILSESRTKKRAKKCERNLIPIDEAEFHGCPRTSAITPIFTARFFTRRTSARCFARQSAAAELQIRAHRLSRARFVVVVSGTEITRPKGQNRAMPKRRRSLFPCKNLDYEMEVGFFVGKSETNGRNDFD